MAFADVGAGGSPQAIGKIPGAAPKPPTVVDTFGGPPVLPSPTPAAPSVTYSGPNTIGSFTTPYGVGQSGFSPQDQQGILDQLGNLKPGQVGSYTGTSGYGNGMGHAGGYQLPDFNTLLQQQLEKLGFGQLDNGLRQQQQQLMIRFGDPSLAQLAGFGVDPQSADFARQNYLSGNADLARLDKASKLAKQQIINQLAAHGLLFSGDTGYQLGQQDTNYGNQRYDLTNKYLDMLNQLQQNVLQQKNQMRQNLVNSLLNFYSQFAANPQQLAGVFG